VSDPPLLQTVFSSQHTELRRCFLEFAPSSFALPVAPLFDRCPPEADLPTPRPALFAFFSLTPTSHPCLPSLVLQTRSSHLRVFLHINRVFIHKTSCRHRRLLLFGLPVLFKASLPDLVFLVQPMNLSRVDFTQRCRTRDGPLFLPSFFFFSSLPPAPRFVTLSSILLPFRIVLIAVSSCISALWFFA